MRDEWFIRGKVPMTKSEVRAVSISRLELAPDSVLWDVGAGTGSVSVEASFLLPEGQVYAVEKNPQAVELIRRNREKFGRDNLTVVPGDAPGALGQLPDPTHVFLGGSGGRMGEILDLAMGRNPRVRVVINTISLESLGEELEEAARYIQELAEYQSKVQDLRYDLEELSSTVRGYLDDLDFDPRQLDRIENRLDLLHRLKKKYGSTVEEILEYAERSARELEELTFSDQLAEQLRVRRGLGTCQTVGLPPLGQLGSQNGLALVLCHYLFRG